METRHSLPYPNIAKAWLVFSALVFGSTSPGLCPGTRFSKVSKSFRTQKAVAKSWTLWLQSCFIHVLLIFNRGSLHTRSFRRIHLSVFRYRLIENGFSGRKSFRGFQETDPCFQQVNWTWARDPIENQHLVSGQLQKTRDLYKLKTWARDMVTWYWSADTLFWQVYWS